MAATARALETELPVDGDRDSALREGMKVPSGIEEAGLVVLRLAEAEVESPCDRRREVVGRAAPNIQTLGVGFTLGRGPGNDEVLPVPDDTHGEVQVDIVRKLDTPLAPGKADSLACWVGLGDADVVSRRGMRPDHAQEPGIRSVALRVGRVHVRANPIPERRLPTNERTPG